MIGKVLPWDSEFFGRRIGQFVAPDLGSPAGRDEALTWARREGLECVYYLTDLADTAGLQGAQALGGLLTDIRVTLDRPIAPTPAEEPPALIRPAGESDLPTLRALAAGQHRQTRFYADPHFPRERCDELYARWIERDVRDADGVVFVPDAGGTACGYLSCRPGPEGVGSIGLLGVSPEARGKGMASALITRALGWLRDRGAVRVTVVTQGNNITAQRAYQKAGFRTAAVGCWFHLWT